MGTRPIEALHKAGINTIGEVLARLEQGEPALLAVDGFGRKAMIDLKKSLRNLGYDLPAASEEVSV